MLIKCPRCDFQQPQDKYCAQCGVDIESYKPNQRPLWKKIVRHPIFHLNILLVLIAAGFIAIQNKGTHSVNLLKGTDHSIIQINRSQAGAGNIGDSNGLDDSANFPEQKNAETEPLKDSSESLISGAVTATHESPPSNLNGEKEKANPVKETRSLASTTGPRLIVTYAEVNKSALASMMEASQATGQFMTFKDYNAGILPNIEKRLASSAVKVLHREERAIASGKDLQWFYGLKDRQSQGMDIGLNTTFDFDDLDANGLHGNLEIQRVWREQNSNGTFEIQKKTFPAILEINSANGFFLAGIMPLQSFLENEDNLVAIDVFKILHSAQFKSGESDFVIFIEFSPGLK